MKTRSALRSAVLTCALVVVVGTMQPLHAAPVVADDPAVIATWDAIAMRTTIANGPPAQLSLAIVSAAMYNAVVTIEGGYEPYTPQPRAHANASPEAAAATAAYRVLLGMFPAASEALAADYATSMSRIPDGVGRVHGVRVGEQAAAAILALRANDGRGDPSITSPPQTGAPGTWVATPPAAAGTPMAAPWLGYVTPLLIDSCSDFPLDGPDPLGSAGYAADLAEVTALGGTVSARTPAQTQLAWFFNDNVIRQYQEGRGLLAASEGLDIEESARMHALLNMTMADTLICTWKAKREVAFWRPITAIRATSDPTWTPLPGGTPPYPEYPSGHASLSGPMANGLEYLFPNGFDLVLKTSIPGASPNTPPTAPTIRHYTSGASLDADTMDARIWLGYHFRDAMEDANQMGHDISDWAIENYFQPTD